MNVDMETKSQSAPSRERVAAIHTELKVEDETFLTDNFLRQLINVGEVDILVGLPTYNNAKTIGSVVRAIQSGILRSFPRERAVIVNADGGSRDGTPELVTGISIDDGRPASNLFALRTLHSISTRYAGSPSSGVALRTILAAAELLRAKACVVMSPESTNIETEWLSKLLRPIYRDGFDLVTPTYRRHKFEGLLMTNLLYPMIRALYGVRIHEPYTSEFGFSGRLGSQFLSQNGWNDGQGVELRLTLAAITGGYRISESFLGEKDHVERRASDLVPTLRETVGVLFSALESDFAKWSTVAVAQPEVPTGGGPGALLDPMRVNRKRLREMFSTGIVELESVFRSILSPSTLAELQRIARSGEDEFHYSGELWVKTVYEFAASFQKSVISRDHIIQALAPLFRGRAFTFLTENRNASANDVENNIEGLCLEFERLKPYLLQVWKSGE
ncbi:MAG: putative Glycosyl transferase, family 2 [Candidatus Sulfotelmatobacter sp.]|nr:putative Glycosyl transferase, family 2 [Candidatus Sulfotelmatobacter sp.]